MRIIVLGEGKAELGESWAQRDLLQTATDASLGALELLTTRVGQVVYGVEINIVGLPKLPPVRPGHTRIASLREVMQDSNLLRKVLYPCLSPVLPEFHGLAAEAAIVTCDSELRRSVLAAVLTVKPYISSPIVHATFDPEFEALLLDKPALERATGVDPCRIRVPDKKEIRAAGGVKEALKKCVREAGYHADPAAGSSHFLARVVRKLGNDFLTDGNPAFRSFRDALSPIFRR